MPQMFQVLRCYKCLVFQVHQTKKSNKFECKMCGEKQSIKRHYGLGNGQECRKHVQKLNGMRGEKDESKSSLNLSTDDEIENVSNVTPIVQTLQNKPSKWSEYVEKSIENTETPKSDGDEMYLDDTKVVLEIPKKRQKIFRKSLNRNQSTKTRFDPVQSSDDNYEISPLPKLGLTSSDSLQPGNATKNIAFTPPIKKGTSLPSDFEIPSHNSSQWADLDTDIANEALNSEKTEICPNQTNNDRRNKFVPPAINKNSKWAKFAEETDNVEENELEESTLSQNKPQNHPPHTLFSLCDDSELDDYLAI